MQDSPCAQTKRGETFFTVFETIIDPEDSVRVFKRRYTFSERQPMLAPVQGILFGIPCVPHDKSILLGRSRVNQ